MEDVSHLESKIAALESENQSLKNVIEQLQAKENALNQTVSEVLNANISLRANCSILEKREAVLNQKTNALNLEIEGLRKDLARSEA